LRRQNASIAQKTAQPPVDAKKQPRPVRCNLPKNKGFPSKNSLPALLMKIEAPADYLLGKNALKF
jgi:hypothetical protein